MDRHPSHGVREWSNTTTTEIESLQNKQEQRTQQKQRQEVNGRSVIRHKAEEGYTKTYWQRELRHSALNSRTEKKDHERSGQTLTQRLQGK
jgi:hypothetical protein